MLDKTFNKNNILAYNNFVLNCFETTFHRFGYQKIQSESIISHEDKSVYFIGSTISIFKKYIANQTIPPCGLYLIQRCVRTQNAALLLQNDATPKWASSFLSVGTISRPENLSDIALHAWEFLQSLGLSKNNLLIRASSSDNDLTDFWLKLIDGPNIKIDEFDISYYRHKYGLPGVWGRNINFSIKQGSSNKYEDIGNLIIIENSEGAMAVELAFGVSTILSRYYSLMHPILASAINMIYPCTSNIKIKFADAIVTSMLLLIEGVRPTASDCRGRILRKYLQSLSYFATNLGLSHAELNGIMINYEKLELGKSSDIAHRVIDYLREFERLIGLGLPQDQINNKISKII